MANSIWINTVCKGTHFSLQVTQKGLKFHHIPAVHCQHFPRFALALYAAGNKVHFSVKQNHFFTFFFVVM